MISVLWLYQLSKEVLLRHVGDAGALAVPGPTGSAGARCWVLAELLVEISSFSMKVLFDMQVMPVLGLHQGQQDQQGLDVGFWLNCWWRSAASR
ncbi:hypothetical protein CCR96_00040 [Halochromatium roseum]|nr:hypothetical protein [Halochromatium roseum]